MSQYPPYPPSPYLPPHYSGPGQAPPDHGPSRRAGILLIVLGGLLLAMGGCLLGASLVPWDQMDVSTTAELRELEADGVSLRTLFTTAGLIMGAPGAMLLLLGVFVRRGSRPATIMALIAVSLLLLLSALNVMASFTAIAQGGGQALLGLCLPALLTGLLVLQTIWLISALRAPADTHPGMITPPFGQGPPPPPPGYRP